MRISDWSSDVCSSDLLFDRSAKQLLKLSEHQGAALYAAQDFSPDGSHLLYTSNEGSEFARLRRYNLADASHTDVESADRSDARRVGKECVSTCRSRRSP